MLLARSIVVAVSLSWNIPVFGGSACPAEDVSSAVFNGLLVTYDGAIADIPIRMTLVFKADGLTGEYFYNKHLRSIRIEGSVGPDRSLTLHELDDKGAVRATFAGSFPEKDPQKRYAEASRLTCEVMVGTWTSETEGRAYPFMLSLTFAQPGELGNRYRAWNGKSNDEASVDSVAQGFVRAVRADDRANIASMLHYPFGVHIEGKGLRIIRTKEQLLSSFELALPSAMRDQVVAWSIPKHMSLGKYDLISLTPSGGPWIGPDEDLVVGVECSLTSESSPRAERARLAKAKRLCSRLIRGVMREGSRMCAARRRWWSERSELRSGR